MTVQENICFIDFKRRNDATFIDTIPLSLLQILIKHHHGERTVQFLYGSKFTANLSGADANVTGIIAGSVVTVDITNALTTSSIRTLVVVQEHMA